MASLSSEKKAQLKKLQSALKKVTERYQLSEKNIAKITTLINQNKEVLDLPLNTKKNRSKVNEAKSTIVVLTERLDSQKEQAQQLHEQMIALRLSVEKLQSNPSSSADIAQGPEQNPDKLKNAVKVNTAKENVSKLTSAIKSQTGILKRENDLLAHYKDQLSKNEKTVREYPPDSEEYEFASDTVKVAKQAIEGQQQTIIQAENKLDKLKSALAKQEQIIKDFGS